MKKYEEERFTLYQADAAEVVDQIAPRSVGLIATDPPYGVNWQSNFRHKRFAKIAGDDGQFDSVGLISAYIWRCLMPNRHVYVFGADHEAVKSRLYFASSCGLIWDKNLIGMGDLSAPWGPGHEVIAFGVYSPVPSARTAGRGALSARLRKSSVIWVQRPNSVGVKRHPTEKPAALMAQIIESSSVAGDCVLDMFAGSGSTLVSAILLGRHAVGVEVDPTYAEVALERCRAAQALRKQIEAV